MNRLIVGCGYVGTEVAKSWLADGESVYAITRSKQRAEELKSIGVRAVVWDWYRPSDEVGNSLTLPPIQSVVVCVSHAPVSGLSPELTHTSGLKNLLNHWRSIQCNSTQEIAIPLNWCYVSTTGVYAPRDDGGWVDESSDVLPLRPGSIAAYAAEQWIQQELCFDPGALIEKPNKTTILRAAGIYGPGRIPRLDSLQNKKPLQIDPESYLNLIHVVDLAGVIVAACDSRLPHRLYNVADGNPAKRRDYYEFIAERIGADSPQFEVPSRLSFGKELVDFPKSDRESNALQKPVARTRGEGSKRIDISRLMKDLASPFCYPSYRTGLSPLLSG